MKVLVVGAGTMGSGIAQVAAVAGHDVTLADKNEAVLEKARSGIRSSLERLAKKGKLEDDAVGSALDAIAFTSGNEGYQDAEIAIEAVFEDLSVKEQVWSEMSDVVPSDALLATNTSSLSVTELAGFVRRPERFCGLHFFNPAPVMELVEVVRGVYTESATIERGTAFVEGLGKTPVVCDDKPGFIVNRLLIPYLNDAVFALSEGVASAADIDAAMKLGANMPMGPLHLCDLIGLDVALAAADRLHDEFKDPKFRPAPLLRQLVRAGKLGRKTGEGFFRYDD